MGIDGERNDVRIRQARIDGPPVRAAISSLKYPAATCARIDDEGVWGIDGERKDVRIRQARIDNPPVHAAISSLKYPAAMCARIDDEGVLGIDGERIDAAAVKSVGLSPGCI